MVIMPRDSKRLKVILICCNSWVLRLLHIVSDGTCKNIPEFSYLPQWSATQKCCCYEKLNLHINTEILTFWKVHSNGKYL